MKKRMKKRRADGLSEIAGAALREIPFYWVDERALWDHIRDRLRVRNFGMIRRAIYKRDLVDFRYFSANNVGVLVRRVRGAREGRP